MTTERNIGKGEKTKEEGSTITYAGRIFSLQEFDMLTDDQKISLTELYRIKLLVKQTKAAQRGKKKRKG